MADGLSEKQQRILAFVEQFLDDHDYPPSIRDIQQGCDISSTSVVDYNLKRLEERGLLRRDREISRAIQLPGAQNRRRAMTVPVLGDMVAVWLKAENETTLKKFFHEGDRIRLQPMNSTMQPFYTSPDNIEVQGRVLSSIRRSW